MKNQKTGKIGENKACVYLENTGYIIVKRNFRVKEGEIDIIARNDSSVAFIEVKTRMTRTYGSSLESLTPDRIKRLFSASMMFLQENPTFDKLEKSYFLIGIDRSDLKVIPIDFSGNLKL